jgi:O-antigen/teichoic acid export membrane protein
MKKIFGLFQSKLARSGIWLFVGSIVCGLFGYIFQISVGRVLTTEDYSLFNAIMAASTVLSAPLGTLMMVVARRVSEYRAKKDYDKILHFYNSTHLLNIIMGTVLFCVFIFFANKIQSYLKAQSVGQVYSLGLVLLTGTLLTINNAFLQGLQSFSILSVSGVVGILLKIIFALILITFGYGVTGALIGTVGATFLTFGISSLALKSPLSLGKKISKKLSHIDLPSIMPILIANLTFVAMTQLDLVFVNYFFNSHEAGLYAAASVLGKAVLYLPGGIALALFPMVAENEANGVDSSHLLIQAIGLVFLLCGTCAFFYFLFGEQLIFILYGKNYAGAGEILKLYGLAILPMTLVVIAQHFLIAKGELFFAYFFLIVTPVQIFALFNWHQRLTDILIVIASSGIMLASISYFLIWKNFKKLRRGLVISKTLLLNLIDIGCKK